LTEEKVFTEELYVCLVLLTTIQSFANRQIAHTISGIHFEDKRYVREQEAPYYIKPHSLIQHSMLNYPQRGL